MSNRIEIDSETRKNIAEAAHANPQVQAMLVGFHRALKLEGEWRITVERAFLERVAPAVEAAPQVAEQAAERVLKSMRPKVVKA